MIGRRGEYRWLYLCRAGGNRARSPTVLRRLMAMLRPIGHLKTMSADRCFVRPVALSSSSGPVYGVGPQDSQRRRWHALCVSTEYEAAIDRISHTCRSRAKYRRPGPRPNRLAHRWIVVQWKQRTGNLVAQLPHFDPEDAIGMGVSLSAAAITRIDFARSSRTSAWRRRRLRLIACRI